MKKILLLILTSIICLAGCKKEYPDPEPVADNLFSVTKEYTCSCGAKYSVTCKNPNNESFSATVGGNDWTYITNPSWGEWKVEDAEKQNVPRYEAWAGKKMYAFKPITFLSRTCGSRIS